MRKIILALAALAAVCTTPAAAQLVVSRSQTGAVGTVVTATDPSGNSAKVVLQSVTLTDSAGSVGGPVQGNVASGTMDSGNPVKIGCRYNVALPALTDGQRADCQHDINGSLRVAVQGYNATDGDAVSNTITFLGSTAAQNGNGRRLGVAGGLFSGTNWDRQRSIQGADGTGLGVTAMATAPTSSANGAITPVVSTAVESAHILKASAGNLYRVSLTAGASAGFLLVFNAATAPVDGAVTPLVCRPVAANGTVEANFSGLPARFSTGITAVFSTTGCFTKTASATAMIEGYVQ